MPGLHQGSWCNIQLQSLSARMPPAAPSGGGSHTLTLHTPPPGAELPAVVFKNMVLDFLIDCNKQTLL